MSDDPITRLNAALEGCYRIESELGKGDDLKHEPRAPSLNTEQAVRSLILRSAILAATILAAVPAPARPQNDDPFPAHQVMDNLYYVGTAGLGTFLITTPEGHILINSDFERTIPLIEDSMESLGFHMADVAIILGSHAHGDHQLADAHLRGVTGAQLMIMEEDVPRWERMQGGRENAVIDRVLHDGEAVTLGGTTLVAHHTPGHTEGCTSWGIVLEENGETYDALIVCSYGVNPNYVLVDNPDYPGIADDYRSTFAKARAIPVDVFVASHGSFYDLEVKHDALRGREPGDPNPFVDPAGYLEYVDWAEGRFQAMLERQGGGGRRHTMLPR